MDLQQYDTEAELIRRVRARGSLAGFTLGIDVPGRPVSESDDEAVFEPVETTLSAHHRVLLDALDRVYRREIHRLMVLMPPGSGKSTYTSVVYPAYVMGRRPGSRVIMTSYASAIAWKQSRRTRQIAKSSKYAPIFGATLKADNRAVEEWGLDNGSEYMSAGILAGMTGNRATDLIIDDPVAGRDEADSETMQRRTLEAYEDDLCTRLMPGGATIIIQTRWNENDLSGKILPADWAGESGDIRCRDGQTWHVLCVPAVCTRADDPLGRRLGEPLWPEWFKGDHFERFKANARTWNSLFQQRPTADVGDYFKAEWFEVRYTSKPSNMRVFGVSDYAVTSGGGNYTEHGVFGIDDHDHLYVLDWWYGQTASDVWIEKMCDLVVKHSPRCWIGESGVIRRSVEPYMMQRMTQRQARTRVEWIPSVHNKEARARSAQAMASMGQIKFPARSDFGDRVIRQMTSFPAGAHDDAVDVIGLAVRSMALVGRPIRATRTIPGYAIGDAATGVLG